ncbi:hypothetical protein EJ06DRAFT_361553 [Trichodelitschia bisporula]|uniref:Uncharacterized protein n=1 Tax=Trichodelitschia bisporula TaxID=703511 RepID=A0A6G1I0T7_9PEZI|nr:hypothetical protein EJ06DRAFT_361553 [Trichodelitschia bisporula]
MTAETTFLLDGAPDALIGTTTSKSGPVQAMCLEIRKDVMHAIQQAGKSDKPAQFVFGRRPAIICSGKPFHFRPVSEIARNEVFAQPKGNLETWQFSGLINHSLTLLREEASLGLDKDEELLQSKMRSIEQERDAHRVTITTPEQLPIKVKGLKSTSHTPNQSFSRPNPTSSTVSVSSSSSHEQSELAAARYATVHLLAAGPRTQAECRHLVRTNVSPILDKVAKKVEGGKWALGDKGYKELDPWKFPYPRQEERETAIDGAIKAYDRMRLSRDDKLWQLLLPVEERGKGKCLSRLVLKPLDSKPVTLDKKAGLPTKAKKATAKKTEEKTPKVSATKAEGAVRKATNGRTTAAEKAAAKKTENAATRSAKAPPDKDDPQGAPVSQRKTASRPAATAKANTTAKKLLNKPKNPSPLSASPVNASDLNEKHPAHRALSSTISPNKPVAKRKPESKPTTTGTKRKLDDSADAPVSSKRVATKPATANGDSSQVRAAKPMANGAPTKRPPAAVPAKIKKEDTSSPDVEMANSNGETDSETSPEKLTWRQTMQLSAKFHQYYAQYSKLYMEIQSSREPPTEARLAEVHRMHQKLAEMKQTINYNNRL